MTYYRLFENKCVDSNIKYRSDKIVEEPVGVPSRANPDPQGTEQRSQDPIIPLVINLE